MPKKLSPVDKSALISVPVPVGTKSRTVISHAFAITTIENALAANGYIVQEEEYKCTTDARVAQGVLKMNDPNNPELMMMFTFSNSYDMSLRFRIAIGATITVNQAYMLNEVIQWKRTHVALTDQETAKKINEHVLKATAHMDSLREAKSKMEDLTINKSMYGQMIGELFINDVLTTDQISAAAKEFENPSFPYTDQNSVWTCYCHVMTVLKDSHPSKWMQNQQDAHMFFVDTFDLVTPVVPIVSPVQALDGEPSVDPEIPGITDGVEVLDPADVPVVAEELEEVLEEVLDPNQTDLLEQIAEEESNPFVSTMPMINTEEEEIQVPSEIAAEMIASEPIVLNTEDPNLGSDIPRLILISEHPDSQVGDTIVVGEDTLHIVSIEPSDEDYYTCDIVDVGYQATPEVHHIGGAIGDVTLEELEKLKSEQDNTKPDSDAVNVKSNIFVDQVDYPHQKVGDVIEVVGDGYCKIVEEDSLEGKPLWECAHLNDEEVAQHAAENPQSNDEIIAKGKASHESVMADLGLEEDTSLDLVDSAADAFLERTPEAEAPMEVPVVPTEEPLEEVVENTQGVIFDDSELQVEELVPAVEEVPVVEESEFMQQLDKDDPLMHEDLPLVPAEPEAAAAPEVEIPEIDTPDDILEEITEEIHEETLVEEELEETLDEIATEELVDEVADEQPSLEAEPVAEETSVEASEEATEEKPELAWVDEPAVGNAEETDPLEDFPDKVVLSNQIPNNPTPAEAEEEEIRNVIAKDIEMLFGEPKEFTYKLEAGEYKIILTETGEPLVLDTEYIKAQVVV